VVVVPFPYSDRLAEKRRPALVVSDACLEDEAGMIWVAMITSTGQDLPSAIAVANQSTTGLGRASWVRPSKLATIEPSRILRQTGELDEGDRTAVSVALTRFAAFAG
jgi:mRNA interferase MazF